MNIKVVGKNIEITGAIREYIEKRLERLEKFEADQTEVTVVCSVEREEQIVEIQINQNGDFIRVEERNTDLYASIDLVTDKAERQLRKDKEKKARKNKEASIKDKSLSVFVDDNNESIGVSKVLYYETDPMTLEDAKKELEAKSDDLFMAFVNSKTGEVNVLYKRREGSFGVVVPE